MTDDEVKAVATALAANYFSFGDVIQVLPEWVASMEQDARIAIEALDAHRNAPTPPASA